MRRWWILAFVLPLLVPISSLHPPFQDWGGHLGVVGALLHESSARFVSQQHWIGPNGLLYLLIFALAKITSPSIAAGVTLAVVLASIGVASAWLCRAAGKDARLAVLALPVAFARPTYSGFIPNVAAMALLVAGLAAYLAYREKPSARLLVLQVVLQIALALTHTFVALASFGLLLIWIAWDRSLRAAIPVVAGVVVLALLFRGEGSLSIAMLAGDRSHVASDFWSWLVAFRNGTIADDLLQIAWLAPIAALIAIRRAWDPVERRLIAAIGATLIAFLLIPMDVGPPLEWWGARGRIPAIAILLAIPLIPIDRMRPLLVASQTAATSIAIYSIVELAIWEHTVMRGFGELIASMPAGRAVSVLWYDVDPERRFPGAPLGHAGGWYVFEKGGGSAQTFFRPKDSNTIAGAALPFRSIRSIPGPPWGIAELFDWEAHREAEIFLVRTRTDASDAPFYGEQLRALTPKDQRGAWRYWTR